MFSLFSLEEIRALFPCFYGYLYAFSYSLRLCPWTSRILSE